MRVCSTPDCPVLIDKAGHCPAHERQRDKARGTRQQRGYDTAHDHERARWAAIIARIPVPCARCGTPIPAGSDSAAWDLGHTDDRSTWTGPEHSAACNRSAAGKASHRTT